MEREEKTLRRIHYRSDFDFLLRLLDGTGEKEIGIPGFDWKAKFYTAPFSSFEASFIGGEFTNCFYDNDRIHIVCKNHKLQCGTLKVVFESLLPDGIYPDGIRREVTPAPLDIELVKEAGDNYTTAEAEALMPYIRGEKGEKGEKGDPGEQGPQGEKGERGVPGLSAYHLAVSGGYAGTSEDFERELAGAGNKQDKLQDSEDIEMDGGKLTVTERAKRSVLLEIFKLRGGKNLVYDEQGDVFSLNGVPDLTWTDMENILFWSDPHLMSQVQSTRYYGCPCKTLFGINLGTSVNLASAFIYSKLQVIVFNGWYRFDADNKYSNADTVANAFQSCGSLREIRGILKDSAKCSWNLTFNGCKALEEVRIASLQHSILLNASPAISLATLDFMITYAANTAAITITVHPDVYAKLTEETNVEWHQVLLDAAEKNIQFATA